MPTIVGLRRRGYTPQAMQLFAERIGVTKSDSWIDYSTLEGCLRESLDESAPRAMAVLDPVKLVLTNWDELFPYSASNQAATDNSMVNDGSVMDACTAPLHPHHPELGNRSFKLGKEVWIERTDFEETPPKGFFRLFPPKTGADGTVVAGNKVRLKYGHVIECTGFVKDDSGNVTEVHATVIPDTKSGTPGSASVKVKGVITWVAVADSLSCRSPPLRPPLHRRTPRRRRQRLLGVHQPQQLKNHSGYSRAIAHNAQNPTTSSSSNATATSVQTGWILWWGSRCLIWRWG